MPTDFVAKWLSLLGYACLKWSKEDDVFSKREERAVLRVALGGIVIMTTAIMIFMLATIDRKTAILFLQVARSHDAETPDASVWLEAIFWLINFLFWLFLSPFFVGKLYQVRRSHPQVYRVFALIGTAIVLPVAFMFQGYEEAFLFVIVPTAVAAIPDA